MKISQDKPPNYEDIKKVLDIHGLEGEEPIFCYGDTIYNAQEDLRPDLIVHEEVHSRQQGLHPQVWWYQYLKDPVFRLEQELEAYAVQYKFIKKYLDNKLVKWGLEQMARNLSSPIYGNIIEHAVAESKIRNYAKRL